MIPESELMAQARRALREGRLDDAQGILINIGVQEPSNDEAWLLLAETMQDPERKMECLERARRIDSRNPTTLRAIQELKNGITQPASIETPSTDTAAPVPEAPKTDPELVGPLLLYAETIAQAVMMSVEPSATRTLGFELVNQIEQALRHDETRVRRWARSAGRDALVKYEKGLSILITNLPQNDPQLPALRQERQRTLGLLKSSEHTQSSISE
jgi:hypothetical protein